MDTLTAIKALEAEWDPESGFVGRFRNGVFDPKGLDRLEQLLRSIDLGSAKDVNRRPEQAGTEDAIERIVELLWKVFGEP